MGVPFPQASVRISESGEIETKGDHVFHGYWQNDEATAEAFDDGWTADDVEAPPLRTSLTPEKARTIIARNTSPDVGFERSINAYKGCEHGWLCHLVTPT